MPDEYYMSAAIKEAKKAYLNGDIPVGCVIVEKNKIIARGYNKREKNMNAIDHAEIIAISKACKKKHNWKLDNCVIFVTLEPCKMCYNAIKMSKIGKIVYGTSQTSEQTFELKTEKINNKMIEIECSNIIKLFFNEVRNK